MSYALTVITVVPTYKGTVALQFAVPAATPLAPVEEVHRTTSRPLSSHANPAIARLGADVVTTVRDGDAIRRLGGVLSPAAGGG